MSGYLALQSYSPFLNLLVGLIGFGGIWGCGSLLLAKVPLPHPWKPVVATVGGMLIFGQGCQVIGFAGWATPNVLSLYLVTWTSIGLIYCLSRAREATIRAKSFHPWMLLFLVPAAVLLLMATSGSTKIDELYYHMLVPARIVEFQELNFFRYPWQAAIPQTAYQIAQAPFHAIGFPHAGNVISSMFALIFSFFAYAVIWQRNQSAFWASVVPAVMLTGMYPMVWYVTGGAHALGDFCIASTIVACVVFQQPPGNTPRWLWSGAISTLIVGSAVTKISLAPVSFLLWLWLLVQLWKHTPKGEKRIGVVIGATAPWLLFYLPLLTWTWMESGSPFGPIMAGKLGESVYSVELVETTMRNSQITNRQWRSILSFAGYGQSILFWMFLVVYWFLPKAPKLLPGLAIGLQAILLVLILPFDLRFLGGTQLAIMILTTIYIPQRTLKRFASRKVAMIGVLACLAPWFALQLVYVAPFSAYVFGLQNPSDFYRRYIAFYDDFQKLDSQLPENAQILTVGVRANNVYFPRHVFTHRSDVPNIGEIYLFSCNVPKTQLSKMIPESFIVGELVHENRQATSHISRIPSTPNKHAHLHVFRLIRNFPEAQERE